MKIAYPGTVASQSGTFRSLHLRNYRVYFIGILISFVGQWMQSTAQSWVVLTELTDEDAAAIGITMALQFAPPLLLVGVTGWVADRFDRRTLIAITQSALLLISLAIGVLLLLDAMTLPVMLTLAFASGVVTAFDNPTRQAFVTDIVSNDNAANAVALNAMVFNVARLVGPAAAGVLLVAVDSGWVFVVNAATFVAMLVSLAAMRRAELVPQHRGPQMGRFADGFRYVRSRADLLVLFVMVFLIGAFGMNFAIYASTMALEFGHDADGFGILTSIFAIGSVSGALLLARRGRPQLRVVVLGTALFGLASFVSALMPGFWWYGLVLVLVGFSLSTV
ncbi:MAG: MFS transporter, partial [Microbacteriaceae bacterium]|nr:MFS transporter [Microbacteriaceae bacterium]